jgi:hypothetical protein
MIAVVAPKGHETHAHFRCQTPTCTLLVPRDWCACVRVKSVADVQSVDE